MITELQSFQHLTSYNSIHMHNETHTRAVQLGFVQMMAFKLFGKISVLNGVWSGRMALAGISDVFQMNPRLVQ